MNDELATFLEGDCVEVMATMPDASVDAVVTDPPYGLEFMGKEWDSFKATGVFAGGGEGGSLFRNRTSPPPAQPRYTGGLIAQEWHTRWATEAYRLLKPGGYLLAFGGTRTVHRLASAIEDAGFEIRDCLVWAYASGFPKSLDVSKAIDRQREGRHDEVLPVTRAIEAAMRVKGWSRRDINREVMGVDWHGGSAQSWTTTASDGAHKPRVPDWDRWMALKASLDMDDSLDAEVWRLNGLKGTPGEAWAQREILQERTRHQGGGHVLNISLGERREVEANVTAPATDAAKRWQGWGTALKPAWEPIVMARKPLIGTVAANVAVYSTGAINIDATRIHANGSSDEGRSGEASPRTFCDDCLSELRDDALGSEARPRQDEGQDMLQGLPFGDDDWSAELAVQGGLPDPAGVPGGLPRRSAGTRTPAGHGEGIPATAEAERGRPPSEPRQDGQPAREPRGDEEGPARLDPRQAGCQRCGRSLSQGRWPANVILTDPLFDGGVDGVVGGGTTTSGSRNGTYSGGDGYRGDWPNVDRQLDGDTGTYSRFFLIPKAGRGDREPLTKGNGQRANIHPTVKPVELMRHLVRLVTPPGGTVLDCFLGSGTTAIAANMEGFRCIGIEREAEYLEIARARMAHQKIGMGL